MFTTIRLIPTSYRHKKMKCPNPTCDDARLIEIRARADGPLKKTTFCPRCRTYFTLIEIEIDPAEHHCGISF